MSVPAWLALLSRPGAIWFLRAAVVALAIPGLVFVIRFALDFADALETGRSPQRWGSLILGAVFLGALSLVAALELSVTIIRRTRGGS
ncbi:MAG: hypothetical protein U0574_09855 [Phycisphaerales bacterium]